MFRDSALKKAKKEVCETVLFASLFSASCASGVFLGTHGGSVIGSVIGAGISLYALIHAGRALRRKTRGLPIDIRPPALETVYKL